MIKLLLVDDEEKTIRGITKMIDWESNGISICGSAANGAQALELIESVKPNIVLTDIRMPVMDGIQLMEKISISYPCIKVIVMSGYADFAYAQKALQYGAVEYLLKPSRAEDILATVLKVKVIIDTETSRDEYLKTLKLEFRKSLPLIKDKMLNDLLRTENQNSSFSNDKFEFLNILLLEKSNFTVILLRFDNLNNIHKNYTEEHFELIKFSLKNITEEILSMENYCEVFENNDDIVSILSKDIKTYDDIKLLSLLEDIKNNVKKFLKLSISVGIGQQVSNISDIPASYKEALEAIEMNYFFSQDKIFKYQDLCEAGYRNNAYPFNEEIDIISAIRCGYEHELETKFEIFFKQVEKEGFSRNNIIKSMLALLFNMYHLGLEKNVQIEEAFGDRFSSLDEILKADSINEIKNRLRDIGNKLCVSINFNKTNNKLLNQAVNFIKDNYYKDISRESVAGEVYITPGYLSILFKQEMNTTFLDFFHKIRIEKACEILKQSDLKISQVAVTVGYSDEKYFFKIFKKYIGITPTQYKEY